ncbi:MAG: DUF4825 domain-containing protein [Bacillota bacterium]|nr:DUF4825 domain-containing protein [Bacillota bacterium]
MKNRNFIVILLIVIGVIGMILVEGYVIPGIDRHDRQYAAEQKDPKTHDFKNVLKYKFKYMGNASNLANLNYNLPFKEIGKTFQLFPEKLTAEINYKTMSKAVDQEKLKEVLIYNSTANFVLIDNLMAIEFNFEDIKYTVSRNDVEKWYGVKLKELQAVDAWKRQVQSKLSDKSYVERFFKQIVH